MAWSASAAAGSAVGEVDGMTLVEFLTARYDEEEQAAREAIAERDRVTPNAPAPDLAFQAWPDIGVPAVVVGPERVLADVDAKRRIVELCQRTLEVEDHGHVLAEAVLRLEALPYADHPDYDESLRP